MVFEILSTHRHFWSYRYLMLQAREAAGCFQEWFSSKLDFLQFVESIIPKSLLWKFVLLCLHCQISRASPTHEWSCFGENCFFFFSACIWKLCLCKISDCRPLFRFFLHLLAAWHSNFCNIGVIRFEICFQLYFCAARNTGITAILESLSLECLKTTNLSLATCAVWQSKARLSRDAQLSWWHLTTLRQQQRKWVR